MAYLILGCDKCSFIYFDITLNTEISKFYLNSKCGNQCSQRFGWFANLNWLGESLAFYAVFFIFILRFSDMYPLKELQNIQNYVLVGVTSSVKDILKAYIKWYLVKKWAPTRVFYSNFSELFFSKHLPRPASASLNLLLGYANACRISFLNCFATNYYDTKEEMIR